MDNNMFEVVLSKDPYHVIYVDSYLDNFKNSRYYEDLVYYYKTVSRKLSINNLRLYYDNIANLNIKDSRLMLSTNGLYYPSENRIVLPKGSYDSMSFYHELTHMSSSRKDNDFIYTGFSLDKGKHSIGNGINEGYTELMTERIFDCNQRFNCYQVQMLIASLIEDIVGTKDMTDLYFNADFKGLIERLSSFNNRNLRLFIEAVDKTIDSDIKMVREFNENKMTNYIDLIVNYLLSTYYFKLKKGMEDKKIRQIDAYFAFEEFKKRLLCILDSDLIFKKNVIEESIDKSYEKGRSLIIK